VELQESTQVRRWAAIRTVELQETVHSEVVQPPPLHEPGVRAAAPKKWAPSVEPCVAWEKCRKVWKTFARPVSAHTFEKV
jgi:hypothetical protein